VLSAGALTGARVRNADGEDLGKIEEILVDVASGRVAYALIASGGVMGIGEKLYAVPWDAFTGAHDGEVLIDADRSRLERAARFDPIRWHDPADPAWIAHLDEFYGGVESSRH
jgi:sporulation protein YlmC with PRC-barrel domain